jgi:hypothetical protein
MEGLDFAFIYRKLQALTARVEKLEAENEALHEYNHVQKEELQHDFHWLQKQIDMLRKEIEQ